ncbi:MAG: preprotein translocase subunit SecE [Betaproteobacteria bacterium CG2_30_59_46]|nr:MAG: preprotein translocase subunit SecE [Betaproteobacteria bacterium CG2_30_59_46]PIQ14287.1 MAG: preprotein translocase subunit SecE [Hydrogenophilales bacterium CG18_big_fil_WC_8_21_14_2_50_58_12]PIY01199.1 MAG: preprotein translocase subunit SecE [Hydrogenophilales bacterium CG_4_10_14_3_um_filter_58_23]PJB08656.1 MAG: preprotein translocase subunit SecE [Hydrogenophilales bacterium CG_4_9_14_3_um_filter_59_35]
MTDKIKLGLAVLLLAAGIAGFYLLSEHALVLRVLAVLVGVAMAISVARFTGPGQQFFAFGKDAWVETKKVVWPTRKETLQTTGVVFLLVVVIAIFLWIVDASLMWAVKLLMGQGD